MDLARLPWYLETLLGAIGVLLVLWLAVRVAAAFKKEGFGLTELSGFAEKVFTKGVFGGVFALGLLVIIGLSVHHFVLGIEVEQLSDGGVMRGWVTLLFSIVGAAMFISVALGAFTYPDLDKEAFERVRGVMTQLVTILGTIIGFYFGSVTVEQSQDRTASLALEASALPASLTPTADSVLVPLDVTAGGGTAPFRWEVEADGTPLTLAPEVQSAAAAGRLTGSLWIDPAYPDRIDLQISVRDHDGHTRSTTHRIALVSAETPVVQLDTTAAPAAPDTPEDTTQADPTP